MFEPHYRITGRVAKALMSIEADRQLVAKLPLTGGRLRPCANASGRGEPNGSKRSVPIAQRTHGPTAASIRPVPANEGRDAK